MGFLGFYRRAAYGQKQNWRTKDECNKGGIMAAMTLRHIRRDEQPFVVRHWIWIVIAVTCFYLSWLVVLGRDIVQHSTAPHPLAFASHQIALLAMGLPIFVYGIYQRYRLGLRMERRYLVVSPEGITVFERQLSPGTRDQEISRWLRTDIGRVRAEPMGQRNLFVFEDKDVTPLKRFLGQLMERSKGRVLQAERWVNKDANVAFFISDPFWTIRLTTRKDQIDRMRKTDLGKALIANGYL